MSLHAIPELLMPAGNLAKLRTAAAYGADAVYVGACGLSMRPDEASFTPEDLAEAVTALHAQGKRLYVAVNSLLFDHDIAALKDWVAATAGLAFDAVILSDTGCFDVLREQRPDLRLHISTQMNTANSGAAAFWKRLGAGRVILSRECSLAQAHDIVATSGIEVEAFVHGAMCVAVSGRCLLSAHLCNHSGSKGDCKHACRWQWELVEGKRPHEPLTLFETGRETIFLGSTDLCLIDHIPELVQSGLSALKVEGRMKSEYYIGQVARVYRAALDAYAADPEHYVADPAWRRELEAVSHRPYATGFAFGYPAEDPASLQTQNRLEGTHDLMGVIEEVEPGRCRVLIKNAFQVGETLEWIAPGMVDGEVRVTEIVDDVTGPREGAHPGTTVSVAFEEDVVLPLSAMFRRERTT